METVAQEPLPTFGWNPSYLDHCTALYLKLKTAWMLKAAESVDWLGPITGDCIQVQFKVMFFTFIAWFSPEWSQPIKSSREKLLLVPNPPGDIRGAGGSNMSTSTVILDTSGWPKGTLEEKVEEAAILERVGTFLWLIISFFSLFLYFPVTIYLVHQGCLIFAFYNVSKVQAKTNK